MQWDAEQCYRAFASHDPRFDGRLFAGVITTGVYCRPICPVRPARPENVRFFPCAAAAEAAGFRPCRRCRPETAPGTPAWLGTSAVVARAIRLLSQGAPDAGDVGALSGRLGVGPRQLRRLFARHLGASPAAIARARRVHFARALVDETPLALGQVAFAAGFRSVRQFNHAVRKTFGRPPSAMRRGSMPAAAHGPGVTLRLPYRPPLDWGMLLAFLAPRVTPGVEVVEGDTYRRTIRVKGVAGAIAVRPGAGSPHLLMRVDYPVHMGLMGVVDSARRLFDLGADPQEIAPCLRRSPVLRALVAAFPGLRVPGAWDGFELAVRAVLGQQVTVRAATTLAGRLVQYFGEPVDLPGTGLSHLFPEPGRLAEADVARIGIPNARARTIRSLALAVARGEVVLDAAGSLDDAVARLSAIPGIGAWTAHYVAMRALGEPDAFPAGDLGLRRAAGGGRGPVSAATLSRMAAAWRPWRAYAAMYLWTGAPRPRRCA